MVPSKAEERIIELMLSGKAPVIITQSKENVVDTAEEIAERQRLAEEERQQINSSDEIRLRQRLAQSERDLATSLRAHTPTADEANTSTVDSADKGR